MSLIKDLYDRTMLEEYRNYTNQPQKFQFVDLGGAALGTYFITQNIIFLKRKFNWWNVVGIGLGVIMLYVHTARFFYAEDTKSGKRNDTPIDKDLKISLKKRPSKQPITNVNITITQPANVKTETELQTELQKEAETNKMTLQN